MNQGRALSAEKIAGRLGLILDVIALFSLFLAAQNSLWVERKISPLAIATAITPILHLFLLISSKRRALRGWRMGLGFGELIIASAITTELFLPIAIVAFVIICSVAISCDFLDRELSRKAPSKKEHPLPPHYIRKSFTLTFFIFLSSAVIFPLLPRYDQNSFSLFGTSKTGYTEMVSLSQWGSPPDSQSGKVLVNIYPALPVDLHLEIFQGLLRARALSTFDGVSWTPGPVMRKINPSKPKTQASHKSSINVEVVREANSSGALPIPYGTHLVTLSPGQPQPRQLSDGTWLDPRGGTSRIQYFLEFDGSHPKAGIPPIVDTATRQRLLAVPSSLKTAVLSKLTSKVFAGAKTPTEKILALLKFFKAEKFSGLQESADQGTLQQLKKSHFTPLEQFLLVTKQGHCEWFASSSAVLLRLAGVPTRLIAGFRISSAKLGNVVTLRSGDAHAWLEAYSDDLGWIPLDPTPRVFKEGSFIDLFTQSIDWVGAYWFRYVVTFDRQKDSPSWVPTPRSWKFFPSLGWLIPSFLAIGFFWLWKRKSLSNPQQLNAETPRSLQKEQRQMEKALLHFQKKQGATQGLDFWQTLESVQLSPEASHDLACWKKNYLLVRFGGRSSPPQSLTILGKNIRQKHLYSAP